jgi:hypothetical protein
MVIQTSANEGATMALAHIRVNTDPTAVLIDFVRALAKRQARIDAGNSEPRTLH